MKLRNMKYHEMSFCKIQKYNNTRIRIVIIMNPLNLVRKKNEKKTTTTKMSKYNT